MNTGFQIFIISVLIAFILLIIHSLKKNGWKETVIFFGFGFIFGLIRELIYRTFFVNYAFNEMPLQLFGTPLTIIFGWIFTFYLGYALCVNFIDVNTSHAHVQLIIFCAIFSSTICFSIETTAMYMGWWKVFFETSSYAASDLLAGWFYTTLLFFSLYFIIIKKLRGIKNYLLPILLIVLIAYIEIVEILPFTLETIPLIILYFLIILVIILLYPYLAILIITLALLFFIEPSRALTTNDLRILIFFIVEYSYFVLILRYPKIFTMQLIKFKKIKTPIEQ